MKVGLIVPGGVDPSGHYRVVPAILWLIQRLAQQHDVRVIALQHDARPDRYDLLGATVHNVGIRPTRLSALPLILSEHRSAPFDVFHAFWIGAPSQTAILAGRLCRRPVVVHAAGGELIWLPDIRYGGARGRWRRAAGRTVLRLADRVTVASGPMAALVRQQGVSARRVTLGVDLSRWQIRAPRPRDRNRPARLVQVASLNPVKDQITLLGAAELLARQGVAFHLDVIGQDTLAGRIERMAHSLDLQDRVTFHGFLPQSSMYPIVAAADLMVVSSRHEAGPVAFLEAAAVGVPTVGTDVGHLHDLAPGGAVTVGVGDAVSLAREITMLLEDDARRLSIAATAQAFVVREDAEWTRGAFESLYRELVPRAAPGQRLR